VFFDSAARIGCQSVLHPRGERFRVETPIRRVRVSALLMVSQQSLDRSVPLVSHLEREAA
jgi:hypothetical protein